MSKIFESKEGNRRRKFNHTAQKICTSVYGEDVADEICNKIEGKIKESSLYLNQLISSFDYFVYEVDSIHLKIKE